METEHLYAPEDEIEARALEGLLRDAGLRFSLRANVDTAYPGVSDRGRGWGELRVHPEDLEAAQDLIADWLNSEAVDLEGQAMSAEAPTRGGRPEPSRAARSVTMLLPWAVLALSLIANWYQWDRHRLRLGSVDVHDAAGRIIATYEYSTSVEFPSELEYFDRRGERTQVCKDGDADGWYEECFLYVDGGRRLHDEDRDDDGRYERSALLDGDRTLSEWHDRDSDGLFDRFVDQHGGEGTDEDGDGVPDAWECAGGGRVDLVHCTVD